MAWDKDEPAEDRRINESDALIRANWSAIEEGGVPYDYIKMKSYKIGDTVIDPYADSGFTRLYCKDVTANSITKPELHFMDEDGDIVQITQQGDIGNGNWLVDSSGNLQANSITFDGGTNSYGQDSISWSWVYWTEDLSGAVTSLNVRGSYGISGVERNLGSAGSGRYRVHFDPDKQPNNANYAVCGIGGNTAFNHTGIVCLDDEESKSTESFVIRTFNRGTSLTDNIRIINLIIVGSS